MHDDTIVAVSTPPGEGGIGILRLSGADAKKIGRLLFRFKRNIKKPESHRLYYGHICDPDNGDEIDEALAAFMSAPHTYTREDMVELNCHGGAMPLSKTLKLALVAGARLAEPGEFTQRAFLNGRIDLAQAEAVIQIIRSKTEQAMSLGLSQLKGRLSAEIKTVRDSLLTVLAQIEASVDFPEHQDVEEMARGLIGSEVEKQMAAVETLLSTADRGKILREGLRTAIVGRPNVGKSSLLNALLKEQRAIVTATPGTTRDIIEESINIGGIALTVIDTAGIRKAEDEAEKIGVERSQAALEHADLVLLMFDASVGLTEEDKSILSMAEKRPVVIIANKTDLIDDSGRVEDKIGKQVRQHPFISMSLLEQKGLEELIDTIKELVFSGHAVAGESVMITSARHQDILIKVRDSLRDVLAALNEEMAVDLLAIDIYSALELLGEITGETVRQEVVEEIFKTFCIGK